MDSLPIPMNVEISTIVHATEDLDKVVRAVKNLLPSALTTEVALRQDHMTGYYKNPIISLTARISERQVIEQMLEKVGSELTPFDRSTLGSEFESCVDEKGHLYIRLDKQAAYLGNLRLRQDDPIRMRIRFHGRPSSVQSTREYCRKVGLIE